MDTDQQAPEEEAPELDAHELAKQDPTAVKGKDQSESVSKTAGKNYLAAARDRQQLQGSRNPGATQQAQKIGNSFLAKNKTKLILGGVGGLAGLGALIGILFFLLLFKNIHIKHLFMDYEFAKFNRAYSTRLADAVREAQPKGDPTTEVDPKAPPTEQLDGANAEEVDKLKASAEAEQKAAHELELVDQSLESTGGDVASEFALDRSVPPETGNTEEERQKSDSSAINDEIAGSEKPGSSIDAVNEGVDAAQTEQKAGGTRVQFSEAGAAKLQTALDTNATLQGALFWVTLGCIARDMYESGYKVFAQLRMAGLARVATTTAKYADGQQLGKITTDQAGAAAAPFDNGKESFTDASAYKYVTSQPVGTESDGSPKNGLDPALQPTKNPGGAVGGLIRIGDAANNAVLKGGCGLVLSAPGQALAALANVIATAVAVLATPATFGLSDVAVIGAQTAGVIIGTKVGKALLVDMVLHYGGMLFKGPFSPIEMGNMMGAGSKVLATDSCRRNGCQQLNQDQNTQLTMAIEQDRRDELKSNSIAYRLFDPANPSSPFGMAMDKVPTSPTGIIASISRTFATLFNPSRMVAFGSNLSILVSPAAAHAASVAVPYNTYGIPDYGFTDDMLNSHGVIDNSNFVKDHKSEFEDFENKCLSNSYADALDSSDASCSVQDDTHTRFRLYALDRRVTHDLVLRYNNQNGGGSAATSAPTTPSGPLDMNTIYDASDNVACGAGTTDIGTQTGYRGGNPVLVKLCTLPNLASSGEESHVGSKYYINGANGLALVNSRASSAFLSLVTAAKAAGIPLGANSSFRTMAHQTQLFNDNPDPSLVAKPGFSNHQMGIAIDFNCSGTVVASGDKCFAWLTQNAGTYGIKNYPVENWHWSVDGK